MQDIYVWSPQLAILKPTPHAERWLIMGPQDEAPLLLNNSAALLWELFENPTSVKDVVEFISTEMGVPRDQVKKDVVSFIGILSISGHLTHVGTVSS